MCAERRLEVSDEHRAVGRVFVFGVAGRRQDDGAMSTKRATGRYILPAALFGACVLLVAAVLMAQHQTCTRSVSADVDVLVVVDGVTEVRRVRLTGTTEVPCDAKPPSTARVETVLNYGRIGPGSGRWAI